MTGERERKTLAILAADGDVTTSRSPQYPPPFCAAIVREFATAIAGAAR